MRLLILSDLHLEFHPDGGHEFLSQYDGFTDYDFCVIAGDLCDFKTLGRSLRLVEQTFDNVVYVVGNHECYGASFGEALGAAADSQVRLLHDSLATLNILSSDESQRILGTTLWFPHYAAGRCYESQMNDFRLIRGLGGEVGRLHETTRLWLLENLKPADVLVTHHLPSRRSIHPKHANSPLNIFFLGDIEGLIAERQPKLVIHGHTHESCDYHIGETRVVCNPYGYHGHEVNPNFDPFFVVDVGETMVEK